MKTVVCICTYRRNAALARLLIHLDGVGVDPDLIVVVDNDPRAGADSLVAEWAVHYVWHPAPGIPQARNAALEYAWNQLGADRVAFLDDDDLPSDDWLGQLTWTQGDTGADLVFGRFDMAGAAGPLAGKDVPLFKEMPLGTNRRYGVEMPRCGTGNVLIADSLEDFRFDPRLTDTGGEDIDFFVRAIKAGASWAVAEGSFVRVGFDPARLTLAGLARVGFQRGRASVAIARLHGGADELARRRGYIVKRLLAVLIGRPATFHKRWYKSAKAAGMAWGALVDRL